MLEIGACCSSVERLGSFTGSSAMSQTWKLQCSNMPIVAVVLPMSNHVIFLSVQSLRGS